MSNALNLRSGKLVSGLSVILLLSQPAIADDRGTSANPISVEQGAVVARQWCSECHVTGQTGTGTDIAPPFSEVARRRDDEYLRSFLANPHGRLNMPPILLDPKEVENVIAYIRTLQ